MGERWNANAHPPLPGPEPTLTITVNGRTLGAKVGETVLDAARRAGVEVPTLCHDDRMKPTGACRMCLVDVSDSRRMAPACRHPVSEGLVVQTESERVKRHRTALLGLYLADQPQGAAPGSALARHAHDHGVLEGLPQVAAPRLGRDGDDNKLVAYLPDHCILCARCTRYCDEVEAVAAISLTGRGSETTIGTADGKGLLDTTCELCGGCIDTCPSGAMVEKLLVGHLAQASTWASTRTTCNYCGVGCQFDIEVDPATQKVMRITSPEVGTTTNDGNLCVKGRFGYGFIDHPDRLKTPLIRGADGALHPTDWDTALDRAATLLLGVSRAHGADALAFVSSSRCTNEENYLVQKLARAGFGTNNVHQCAAT